MNLTGKTAVITGGARGIGFAVAKKFVELGAKVVLWDLNKEELEKASAKLKEMDPKAEVSIKAVNVTDTESVDSAIAEVKENHASLDVMINNAGITADSMLHKMDDDKWDRVISVNLKGVFICGRAAARVMRDQGNGVILNTSSVVGLNGNIGQTNYAATKAGVIGMTQTWAKELSRKNIRVNAVAPGYTMTEMMETVPEKVLDGIRQKTPLNRLAKPSEIADAFAFLASDMSTFITGQVLNVNGGLVL